MGLTALLHPLNLIFLVIGWFVSIRFSTRACLVVGAAVGFWFTPAESQPVTERTFVDTQGTVVSLARPTPYGSSFTLATGDRTWRVAARGASPPSMGDRMHVVGVGLPLREGSEELFLLHGIGGRLTASRLERVAPGPAIWRVAQAWRTDFRRFCRRWMSPAAADLTEAMCFDLNSGVDPAVVDRFKDTGTLHVLVASGMHVLVLAGAVLWLVGRLPMPRSWQIAILAASLAVYCGATGLTPAVVRAALMTIVGLSAYLFRREPDALSALALAAIAYLLWQPREVYDAGFQLSFVTVGGIAMFYRGLRREAKPIVKLAHDSISIAWIAFASSAPLLAYYFGSLSVVSLPANLAIGAAASIGILSAFAAHLMAFVFPALGVGLLAILTEPMAGWILWASERLGGQVWSSVAVPAFSPYWLVVMYAALLLTWRPRIVQP